MPVIFHQNIPGAKIDASNIASMFTSKYVFSVLYKTSNVNTLGYPSFGTLKEGRDVNIFNHLHHITTISSTQQAFVAERYYYEVMNNNNTLYYWLQPININYIGDIVQFNFFSRTIQDINILKNKEEVIRIKEQILYILSNSGLNKNIYRSKICSDVFEQNDDISYFIYNNWNDFMFDSDLSIYSKNNEIRIYKPNQTIVYNNDVKDNIIYIPLRHIQSWFEIRTKSFLFVVKKHRVHDIILYISQIDNKSETESHIFTIDKNMYSNNDMIYPLQFYAKPKHHGIIITTFIFTQEKKDNNDSFKRKYGSLIRHRPLK